MSAAAEPWKDAALAAWIDAAGGLPDTLTPLAGDVSTRRYDRLGTASGGSAVLAVYPPSPPGACRRFVATGRLLESAGVPVPRVLAHDCDRGWMLLEDLGAETLYDRAGRPWEELTPYFDTALELARRIARLPAREVAALSPPLDGPLLARELAQTWELFLEPRGLAGAGTGRRRLRELLEGLCARLGEEPPVPCHRDFMARNLIPRPRPRPRPRPVAAGAGGAALVVLDHQDLRLGPPWYDLASLLNDSLFPPAELVEGWLARTLPPGEAPRLAYHRAAAQRTLKAVGTFAAFARRGSDRHLPLIPPTLGRALHHLRRLPEARELAPELGRRWWDAVSPGDAEIGSDLLD